MRPVGPLGAFEGSPAEIPPLCVLDDDDDDDDGRLASLGGLFAALRRLFRPDPPDRHQPAGRCHAHQHAGRPAVVYPRVSLRALRVTQRHSVDITLV